MPSLPDATNYLSQANNNFNTAQNNYNALNTGSNYIGDALKTAIMNKFNGNQDLVNDQSGALNQYLNAGANAHANFSNYYNTITGGNPSGVVNPYAFNDYAQNNINNAYTNYQNANNLMTQRTGTINDLVKSGTDIYGAQSTAAKGAVDSAQGLAQQAQQQYQNAYQATYDAPVQQAQANYYNGLGNFYAGGAGSNTGTAAPTDTYQNEWNLYQNYLQGLNGNGTAIRNPIANNNASQAQNNLYQYLTTGAGSGLQSPIKQQLWNTWQQLNNQYEQYKQKNTPTAAQVNAKAVTKQAGPLGLPGGLPFGL